MRRSIIIMNKADKSTVQTIASKGIKTDGREIWK